MSTGLEDCFLETSGGVPAQTHRIPAAGVASTTFADIKALVFPHDAPDVLEKHVKLLAKGRMRHAETLAQVFSEDEVARARGNTKAALKCKLMPNRKAVTMPDVAESSASSATPPPDSALQVRLPASAATAAPAPAPEAKPGHVIILAKRGPHKFHVQLPESPEPTAEVVRAALVPQLVRALGLRQPLKPAQLTLIQRGRKLVDGQGLDAHSPVAIMFDAAFYDGATATASLDAVAQDVEELEQELRGIQNRIIGGDPAERVFRRGAALDTLAAADLSLSAVKRKVDAAQLALLQAKVKELKESFEAL